MKRAEFAAELSGTVDVAGYLTAHSGLPGPRSNLTLLDAAGDVLPRRVALAFLDVDDEYLACCGTVTLARLILAGETALVPRLTLLATDPRWRVRESVAIAAQRIGDEDPTLLRKLVARWVSDSRPLVVRAGIASICEPRLLHDPATADAALTACRLATDHLLATPAPNRRDADVRTLRQALGYCWSVAVAAVGEHGLIEFSTLPGSDPDVAWMVRENRRKKRLASLLGGCESFPRPSGDG